METNPPHSGSLFSLFLVKWRRLKTNLAGRCFFLLRTDKQEKGLTLYQAMAAFRAQPFKLQFSVE